MVIPGFSSAYETYFNLPCITISAYAVIGMVSAFGFRAVQKALPKNPAAQERIIGASLSVLATADVSVISATQMR